MPVVVSTLFETGVGIAAGLALAAALPDVRGGGRLGHAPDHGLATAGLLEHDLLAEGLVLDGGRLRAPGAAGAGRLGDARGRAGAGALRRGPGGRARVGGVGHVRRLHGVEAGLGIADRLRELASAQGAATAVAEGEGRDHVGRARRGSPIRQPPACTG